MMYFSGKNRANSWEKHKDHKDMAHEIEEFEDIKIRSDVFVFRIISRQLGKTEFFFHGRMSFGSPNRCDFRKKTR